MGWALADSNLGRKERLVQAGGWARCCNLRCPGGIHRWDAQTWQGSGAEHEPRSAASRPIHPGGSIWAYISAHLQHRAVAWLLPCAHGTASCPGKEARWEVWARGVRRAPANRVCRSRHADQALPKIDVRKQNFKERGWIWHETYSWAQPLS